MKKIFLAAAIFFLGGCSGPSLPLEETSGTTHQVQVGEHQWEFVLPEGWEIIPVPQSVEALFFARSGHENFVITRHRGAGENLMDQIMQDADKGFYTFEEISRDEVSSQFRAKLSVTEPQRDVWQKISPIPETEEFLLASCSLETSQGSTGACETLIPSFEILVDNDKEND
ncbi:MAG: hypothetical protein K9M51_03340 [Candidatus Gracilibacteria bacterium]|nr:hypothetical protein [Candidatus Gracilibacteria bacterium]